MTVPALHFTPNDSILVYENAHHLQFWHLQDHRLLHQHDGTLLAIAKHGRSFLLYTSHGTTEAYDSLTGAQIPIQSISPEAYTAGQLYKLRPERTSVEVTDVLRNEVIRSFHLADFLKTVGNQDSFSNVCLSQDGSFIAVTIAGDSTWGEWALGYYLPLMGKLHFEFSVNPFANHPILEMAGNYLLVESAAQEHALWDMQTGNKQQRFSSINAKAAKYLLAVNTVEVPPIIALWVDPHHVTLYQTGALRTRLTAPQEILHAEFLPDNHQIALLLENKTVVFHDWRTGKYKDSLNMA
jgi:WD40 repeat protein